DVHALTIGLGHPQVERLQRGLADQFRIQRSIDVTQLIDWCRVIQSVGHYWEPDCVETEALDLRNLLFPTHGPKELRLKDGGVETEVADAAYLDFLAVFIVYVASLREIADGPCARS